MWHQSRAENRRRTLVVALTAALLALSTLTAGPADAKPSKRPVVSSISPASGIAGAKVTVKGKNFTKRTKVYFGTKRATRTTYTSSKKLVAVAPTARPGTVAVTVRTGKTKSKASRKGRFTYRAIPASPPAPAPAPAPAPPVQPPAAPTTGTVTGTVTSGGSPVAKVVVAIDTGDPAAALYSETDATGSFTLAQVPPGSYVVCFYPPGDQPSSCYGAEDAQRDAATRIDVAAGDTVSDIDASLPSIVTIRGTVRTTSGDDAAATLVRATPADGSSVSTTTDDTGAFRLDGLVPGTYEVCAIPLAEAPIQFDTECLDGIVAQKGSTTEVSVVVPDDSGISGRVSDADDEPVAGASVEIRSATSGEASFVSTGPDGSFRARGVEAGDYSVCVHPAAPATGPHLLAQCVDGTPGDVALPRASVTVEAGSFTTADLTLTLAGAISGTVTDLADRPLGDVDVEATGDGGLSVSSTVATSADGSYTIADLPAGSYTVCFRLTNLLAGQFVPECFDDQVSLADAATSVDVRTGQTTTDVDAQLAGGASVSGTVAGGEQSAPDVAIELTSSTGSTFFATADATGRWTVSGLPAGTYRVCAYPPFGPLQPLHSSCHGGPDLASATAIEVGAEAAVSDIAIELPAAGTIAGTIVGAGDVPLAGVEVAVIPQGSDGAFITTETGESGQYRVGGLPPGPYAVCFYPADGYAAECHLDAPVDGSGGLTLLNVTGGSDALADAILSMQADRRIQR